MHTAFVQVGLKDDHDVSSFDYMDEVRKRVAQQLPELRAYLQSGGLVDSVLNQGMPAPIDVQVSGIDLGARIRLALDLEAGSGRCLACRTSTYPRIWIIPRCR